MHAMLLLHMRHCRGSEERRDFSYAARTLAIASLSGASGGSANGAFRKRRLPRGPVGVAMSTLAQARNPGTVDDACPMTIERLWRSAANTSRIT
jgi:hypothetical protein